MQMNNLTIIHLRNYGDITFDRTDNNTNVQLVGIDFNHCCDILPLMSHGYYLLKHDYEKFEQTFWDLNSASKSIVTDKDYL